MPSTKVAVVTFEYGDVVVGGIGTCLNGLLPHLRKYTSVEVFLVNWNEKIKGFSCRHFNALGLETYLYQDVPYLDAISTHLSMHGMTHLHLHHASPQIADLALKIRSLKVPIKIVYTCHSILAYDKLVRTPPPGGLVAELKIIYFSDIIHSLTNKSVSRLISAINASLIRNKVIKVIPNGIDLLTPQSPQNKSKIFEFFCCSRWIRGKGLETLVRAFEIFNDEVKGTRLTLVGRDDKSWIDADFSEELSSIIAQSTAAKNIKALDWQPAEVVRRLMSASNIVVSPSSLEYFPYSFLEPASMGVPIIYANIDPVSDFAIDGNHCHMFSPNSESSLAQAMRNAYSNTNLRQMGDKARSLVAENFSWKELSREYLSLYI